MCTHSEVKELKVKMKEEVTRDTTTVDEKSISSIQSFEINDEDSIEEDFVKDSIIQLAIRNGLDTTADDREVGEFIELIEKSGLSMRNAGIKVGEVLRATWSLNIVRI